MMLTVSSFKYWEFEIKAYLHLFKFLKVWLFKMNLLPHAQNKWCHDPFYISATPRLKKSFLCPLCYTELFYNMCLDISKYV